MRPCPHLFERAPSIEVVYPGGMPFKLEISYGATEEWLQGRGFTAVAVWVIHGHGW